MPAYKPIEQRIADLSIPEPNSGCWLWLGSICEDGYGKAGGKETLAHRLSYKHFIGPIPDGLEIDHKCRVRCCVNPKHLRLLTHAENASLAIQGENHRNTRKTCCKRGHLLSGENLILEKGANGSIVRQCRACRNERQRLKARRAREQDIEAVRLIARLSARRRRARKREMRIAAEIDRNKPRLRVQTS